MENDAFFAPVLHKAAPLGEGEALGVVVEDRHLDLVETALTRPVGDRLVERGAGPPASVSGQDRHDGENELRPVGPDQCEPRADRLAVHTGEQVDVIDQARLERVDFGQRVLVVGPDGVVEVERKLFFGLVCDGRNLDHAATTAKSRHSPGTPLSSAWPRSSNARPEPATRSCTVPETRISPGPGAAGHPRADVNRYARELLIDDLALAGVHPGTDLQAQPAHGVDRGVGAADRARRPVEAREEPVARGVDLAPAKALELAPNRGVVSLQQLAPAPVAELGRPLRRADDVGEEHRREHAVGLGRLAHAGQELADLVEDLAPAVCPGHVRVARQLDVPCAGMCCAR